MSGTEIMALIAMVGTGIGLMFNAVTKRDQLKYDVKMAVLEDRQKRCEEDGAAKAIRISVLEAHIVTLTATDAKDRVELEAKITDVKNAKNTPVTPDLDSIRSLNS